MGQIDWNTPPTEAELSTNSWNTPPTEQELGISSPIKNIAPTESMSLLDIGIQAGKDIGSGIKGMVGQVGSLGAAIPANLAEAVGMDASAIRDSQAYWQGLTKEAKDELTKTYGNADWAKEALFSAANPLTYIGASAPAKGFMGGTEKIADKAIRTATTTPLAVGLTSGIDTAGRQASTSDMTPINIKDVGNVATDIALGTGLAKVADLISPQGERIIKTKFGKTIDELPKDEKLLMTTALNKIDEVGGTALDEATRSRLIMDLDIKSKKPLSKQILSSLAKAEKEASDNVSEVYKQAHKLANTTDTINTKPLVKDLLIDAEGAIEPAPTKAIEDAFKAYREVRSILEISPVANAREIEKKLVRLKSLQRAKPSSVGIYYNRAIDSLTKQQDEILKANNQAGLYDNAREAWKTWQKNFKGEIAGEGVTGGKKIDSVLTAQNNNYVSKELLGGNVDANLAEQVGRNFTKAERKDMVMDVLSEGIDEMALDTPDGVAKLFTNYKKANPEGLRAMLGANEYKSLDASMKAIEAVQTAIMQANKQDMGIGKDIVEMGAAAAAFKISPYAAVHAAINKSKSILDKVLFNKNRHELIKRIQGVKDTTLRNKMLKAMSIISIPVVSEDIENKEIPASSQSDNIGTVSKTFNIK